MKRLRSLGAITLAAVLLMIGQALAGPPSAVASAGTPPPVPDTIAVPAGAVLLFARHARGAQIYDCVGGAWALHAPHALLFDPRTNRPVGEHFGGIDRGLTPGPWWASARDGSRIRGGNPVSAPSPNPDSIPLLRLAVLERSGAGEFTPASYIQRLNTIGGVSPTGACQPGAQRWVPYTADYYFYAAP